MSRGVYNEPASEKPLSRAECVRRRQGFTLLELLAVMSILSLISVSLFTIFQQGTETWRQSAARTEAYMKARQILDMMSREIKGAVLITAARGPKAFPDKAFRVPKRADFTGLHARNGGGCEGWRNAEQGYSDQIYFVAPVTNSGKQELCMIGYWIKDVKADTSGPPPASRLPSNSSDDTLQRSYRTDTNGTPDEIWATFNFADPSFSSAGWEATGGEVVGSVRLLEIKYYDYDNTGSLKEYDAWDSLPSTDRGTTVTKDDDNKLPVAVRITVTVGDKNDIVKGIRLSTLVYLEGPHRRLSLEAGS